MVDKKIYRYVEIVFFNFYLYFCLWDYIMFRN